MRMRHGGLGIDIPEGWADQSTLLFVAPLREQRLPTARQPGASTEAISINFMQAGAKDAAALTADHIAQLSSIDPERSPVGIAEPFETGLGMGALQRVRLTISGVVVRQLVVAVVVAGIAVVAQAACPEWLANEREPALTAILKSLGFAQDNSAEPAAQQG